MPKKKTPEELRVDNALIDAAGGPSKVAQICEVFPQAVSQWRTDGIPKARLMYLRLVMPEVFAQQPTEAEKAGA